MKYGSEEVPKSATRRAAKRSRIVGDLRQQILEGVFPPGSRLPTRSNLEERFGVSSVTVQRAIDSLVLDGFIYARHRQGTFVAENPPHLSNYGLVIPYRPDDPIRWSRFFTALSNEAKSLPSNPPRKITVYHGIDDRASHDEYVVLRRDLESRRLAGLIFGASPHCLDGTPLITQAGVPRVGVMPEPAHGMPAVFQDYNSFLLRAQEYLNRCGRRRVAYLLYVPPGVDRESSPWFAGQAMTAPSYWTQYATPWPPQAAQHAIELLMRGPANDRPDGLIITDDNLVESALAGLHSAGVRVPQDLDVVAHCNFPAPIPAAVGIQRLGFDAHTLLDKCLHILDAQRKGQPPAPLTLVPAVFENEMLNAEC